MTDAHPPSPPLKARKPLRALDPGAPLLRKPAWIRVRAPVDPEVARLRALLRNQRLHTVCEEAACPNLGECFARGTATFLVLGALCTRCCPFCDIAHGRPAPPDPEEPRHLAEAVAAMGLSYVVITSVDRDDLPDGGASHFAACLDAVREQVPGITVEVLVPDFKGRVEAALGAFADHVPDVFNHNLETVPRLYRPVRPGADYGGSLRLLAAFAQRYPEVPIKSGLMLGLGEEEAEILEVLADLRAHHVTMLTMGQYLQPTRSHLPITRFVPPEEFRALGAEARRLGFRQVASGPLVRSSYYADQQHDGLDGRPATR
jgi:lipoic acid synthetase